MICQICLDNVPLLKSKCGHEFCQSCLDAFIKDALDNRFKVINCPSCPYLYTLEDISFLSPKNLEQYVQKRSLCVDCHQLKCRCSGRRCPQCHIQIEKLSGCNHMTCRCKFEFCWLCQGKFSIYHYRLWNITGCPIPGGMMSSIKPLKYPNLFRLLMIMPKIIALVIIITFILIIYPFFCFYNTIRFHRKLYKKKARNAVWVLLFPFTYLVEFFWKGPKKVRTELYYFR